MILFNLIIFLADIYLYSYFILINFYKLAINLYLKFNIFE